MIQTLINLCLGADLVSQAVHYPKNPESQVESHEPFELPEASQKATKLKH